MVDLPPPDGIPMGHRIVVDVIRRPEYIVGFEQINWTTYAHVVVAKWSASVARQFRQDIDTAHALLGQPIYAADDPDNPTLRKFLKLHGFVYHSRVRDVFGRDVDLFERAPPRWVAAELAPTLSRIVPRGHPNSPPSCRASIKPA